MAKGPILADVTNLANAVSALATLNNNAQALQDAFANTVSRDGSTPNYMEADFDLNTHKLLNVEDPVAETDGVNLRSVRPLVDQFASEIVGAAVLSTIVVDQFAAVAGQTTFTLSQPPGSINNVQVSVDGLVLRPQFDYTLIGPTLQTLLLVTPLSAGQRIAIRYAKTLPVGTGDADSIIYTPVVGPTTTVEAKLQAIDTQFTTLAGPSGANSVGAIQSGTGAIAESMLADYQRTVSPEQFGAVGNGTADDTSALQNALNRAAGGVLRLTPGRTYGLSDALQVPSSTTVDARGATIKRLAGINNMLRNKGDGVTGGYAQNFNIAIIGGTWTTDDAFAAGSPCTVIGFTHCTGIWIQGCDIRNPTDWHHVELNGCQAAFVDRCIFQLGANRALTTNEAIQIDANMGGGQWPWQGPADSTACTTVKITNCWFNNVGTGVGTHSGANGVIHNDIAIDGCTFFQPFYAGVHTMGWSGVKVTNCRFYEGGFGVFGDMQNSNIVNDYLIANNTFFRIGYTSFSTTDARAVLLNGDAASTQYVRNFRILGNFVGGHNNTGKSRHALTANYCIQGVFANNILQDINNAGIWAFGCSRVNIIGNELINTNIATGSAGIIAGGTGSVNTVRINISSNTTDTMNVSQCDRTIARNNIVTTAAGLTSSGNTNTTISENLVDTTFA